MAVRTLTRQELKTLGFNQIAGSMLPNGAPVEPSSSTLAFVLKTVSNKGPAYSKTLFGTFYTDGDVVYFSPEKHDLFIRDIPEIGRSLALPELAR